MKPLDVGSVFINDALEFAFSTQKKILVNAQATLSIYKGHS